MGQEELLAILPQLTIMDDAYGKVFLKDTTCLKLLIEIIAGIVGLSLSEIEIDKSFVLVKARKIVMDIFVHGSIGEGKTLFNIEIQRDSRGAILERLQFHAATITVTSIEPGEDFNKVPNIFVIFLVEHDVGHKNEAIYRKDIAQGGHNGKGLHLIYLNLSYTGKECDQRVLALIHDLKCANPNDMVLEPFRSRGIYLKTTEVGRKEMTGVLGQLFQKGVTQGAEFAARNMLIDNESFQKIVRWTGLPLSRIEELKRDIDSAGAK